MARIFLVSFAFLLFAFAGFAQDVDRPTGTREVGLVLTKIPEALMAHLPKLRPGQGIMVDQVLPDSRAAQAGFQRHDILLSLGKTAIHHPDHFSLLLAGHANQKVSLSLLRRGQEMNLLLQVPADFPLPKGTLKPGGPPAVTVEAKSFAGGQLSVTFTYFSDAKSKLERVTYSGSLPEIEKKVHADSAQNRMPVPVQDLVDAALERLRRRQLQAPHNPSTPAKNQ